jgi:BASS family bile acid:Na+ symporter
MTLAQIIVIVLQVSIGLIVFCLALRAEKGDLSYLLRHPSLFARSVLSMNVLMPLFALAAAVLFKLRPEVEVALVLLALSPVPPVLPGKQGKAGGSVSYAIGLLMMSALLAIVLVPLSVMWIGRSMGREDLVPLALVAKTVGLSVVGPLLLGVVVRNLAPAFAAKAAGPLSKLGTLLVLVAFLPVLVKQWPAIMAQVGDKTLLAIVVFTVAGLVVGHLLGGPAPEDRTVLALATANRHPGVALAIAAAVTSPENRGIVSAAVFLAFLAGAIVVIPYVKWRKKSAAVAAPVPA